MTAKRFSASWRVSSGDQTPRIVTVDASLNNAIIDFSICETDPAEQGLLHVRWMTPDDALEFAKIIIEGAEAARNDSNMVAGGVIALDGSEWTNCPECRQDLRIGHRKHCSLR